MQLYLDMDGVLMNYEAAIEAHGVVRYKGGAHWISKPRAEWPQEMIDADKSYVGAMLLPTFWNSIQPMDDAKELWDFCRPLKPHVLTAAPTDRPGETQFAEIFARIGNDKCYSMWKHFDSSLPRVQINVCLRHQKADFATSNGMPNVLVDDTPGNCDEWTRAGGIAVLHLNANHTIDQLRGIFRVR